jgi:acyl-CoA synthetase (AMP-forming)/AMP-acid ligase II
MNVANQITDIAIKYPYRRAVVMPEKKDSLGNYTYSHLTFIQFEKRINQLANKLINLGVKKGQRVLLFVKPSKDFSALTFALFKLGAVPVMIDPGMGVKNFLSAITQVKADVLIGIPKVHLIRQFFRKPFLNIKLFITTGKLSLFGNSIHKNISEEPFIFDPEIMNPNDPAAILFTSGGTGTPKGVVYTHDIFINQTKMLQEEFSLDQEDVDIPGFPLFALFTLAMGMTSCIPDMDPSKPKNANPKKLVQNIMDQGATFVAGSPAIWENVADFCIQNRLTLPSIKYLVMFGAPIPVSLHKKFKKILINGTTYTPYGATECLPVSNISGTEVLEDTAKLSNEGLGTCVGFPFDGVTIKIIKEIDGPIAEFQNIIEMPTGSIGEIIVKSPSVTPEYFLMPAKTRDAKIFEDNIVWHRMGDVGYLDDQGKLWFCGRKTHVVKIKDISNYSIPVEAIFNNHPEVKRSALVKIQNGIERAGIVIERKDKKTNLNKENKSRFFAELIDLASEYDHTKEIHDLFLHKNFPVDVRHNIKIDRTKLTNWANEEGI